MSSAISELISPFARILTARGSSMHRTMATWMRRPCPGPHTPGASANEMTGRRRIRRGGVWGEAAAKRVASCNINECSTAIRVTPTPPGGSTVSTVDPLRVSPLKHVVPADQVSFPHAQPDSTHPLRAAERINVVVIVEPSHVAKIVNRDVHPHHHIRSSSELVPSLPAPAGTHDGVGDTVASHQIPR